MPFPSLPLILAIGERPVRDRRFDLFLPAVNASADDTLHEWHTSIPSTYELCRRVDADCREAAWDGTLRVVGPDDWRSRFVSAVHGLDPTRVAEDYAVLEAAVSVRQLAFSLSGAIRNASVGEAGQPSVHPLAERDTPSDDVPFGFAVSIARWKGVNPKAFVDFAVGSGSPDAEAFLETVIRHPARWFHDISSLEDALRRLAADKDIAAFRDAVADWNAKQDVSIMIPNRDVVVPAIWARTEDAIQWGDDFLRSSDALVRALIDDNWAWWKT
jgi:hypothetical protein|nr:hypothetical protein [Neorhizobium tomejilense]